MADRPHVLLAEDEEMHSFPMEVALKRAGFDVSVVRDAKGVIQKGPGADALVIDARLPSEALEGLHAAADLVRGRLPNRIPIIFVSIYPENTPKVERTLADLPELTGRYVWMEKWFEPSNLAKILRRLIAERAQEAAEQGGP